MVAFPNTINDDDHRISMTSSVSMANVKRPTEVVVLTPCWLILRVMVVVVVVVIVVVVVVV